MFRSLICILIFCSTQVSGQQKTDRILQRRIEKLLQGFHGTAGVFIKELRKNFTVSINSDTIFPTASMVKIPILIGVMNKINYGELSYHQELQYRDSLLYAGVDILGSFKQDEKIELSKVMMLMLTMSDNTASLWLQSLAGTGATINRLLDSIGFEHTRVNSRTPGRDSFRMQYGWGQTTPRELAQLMEKIYRGEIINRDASNKMLRLLGRNYWDEAAVSQIPPGIFVASKNGAVNDSRSEILFVSAPSCPYILCIATKNNADESWTENNEAWVLARNISAAVWKHYGKRSDTRK